MCTYILKTDFHILSVSSASSVWLRSSLRCSTVALTEGSRFVSERAVIEKVLICLDSSSFETESLQSGSVALDTRSNLVVVDELNVTQNIVLDHESTLLALRGINTYIHT